MVFIFPPLTSTAVSGPGKFAPVPTDVQVPLVKLY
jgi:hypothetical protein